MPRAEFPSWVVKAAAALRSADPRARRVEVIVRSQDAPGTTLRIKHQEEASAPEDDSATAKILQALDGATSPLKARTIARMAGLSYDGSHFKLAMSRLSKAKRIVRPDPTVAEYSVAPEG